MSELLLKTMRCRGLDVPISHSYNIFPFFSNMIQGRITEKKSIIIEFVGEAGISKTYSAVALARYLQGKSFKLNQIFMTYPTYLHFRKYADEGDIGVFDEPQDPLSHRSWSDSVQKAIVHSIENMRYRCTPLFLPVIDSELLDKTVRKYMINFKVRVMDRGVMQVYQRFRDNFKDKTYHVPLGTMYVGLLDGNCGGGAWCPSCKLFTPREESTPRCERLRAQYERLKRSTLDTKLDQTILEVNRANRRALGFEEWLSKLIVKYEECLNPNVTNETKRKMSTERILMVLKCPIETAKKLCHMGNTHTIEELRTLSSSVETSD